MRCFSPEFVITCSTLTPGSRGCNAMDLGVEPGHRAVEIALPLVPRKVDLLLERDLFVDEPEEERRAGFSDQNILEYSKHLLTYPKHF